MASRLTLTQRIVVGALGAALLGGLAAPAAAADIGVVPRHHVKHAWTRSHWGWRERCAHAGYYCLYAEYGFVYHYPFDDRPGVYHRTRRF